MCQWGAKAMADNGDNFRQILKYYYTGVGIETI
jgi:SpoIID/LytB domain protein